MGVSNCEVKLTWNKRVSFAALYSVTAETFSPKRRDYFRLIFSNERIPPGLKSVRPTKGPYSWISADQLEHQSSSVSHSRRRVTVAADQQTTSLCHLNIRIAWSHTTIAYQLSNRCHPCTSPVFHFSIPIGVCTEPDTHPKPHSLQTMNHDANPIRDWNPSAWEI